MSRGALCGILSLALCLGACTAETSDGSADAGESSPAAKTKKKPGAQNNSESSGRDGGTLATEPDAALGSSPGNDGGGPAGDAALADHNDSGATTGPGADAAVTAPPSWVTFTQAGGGFSTDVIYDSNREAIQFDAVTYSMVRKEDGNAIEGWRATGTDLKWARSGVAFAVAFGSEGGVQRAYFTEVATGTICDLVFLGPRTLQIFPTDEAPPQN